ncbi:MAG: signal peptidase I [Chloroflexi bacterium]|nr:signal peptidase I [Chloroflexota bacterium]
MNAEGPTQEPQPQPVETPDTTPHGKGRSPWATLREITETLVLALVVFIVLQNTLQTYRVEGGSMEPTLHGGERVMVNKVVYSELNLQALKRWVPFLSRIERDKVYLLHPPQRGDVIVFRLPRDPRREFVKRVIAIPGDVIEVREGKVYVNEAKLEEPYIKEYAVFDMERTQVPLTSYFVLGDNRPSSNDSRNWGPVPEKNIRGKVWLRYWPISDLKWVGSTFLPWAMLESGCCHPGKSGY